MEFPTVIYEDAHLVAVSKPAGQVVIPGRGELGETLQSQVSRRAGAKVLVVHRLDREASGLVLFAKDADTHRSLCLQFQGRKVRKTYLAVVSGEVKNPGKIEEPLKAFGSGRIGAAPGGKPSLTRYRVLRPLRGATLLEVEPLTGRRHQIRAHLTWAGHAVLGDKVYGRERPVGGAPRLMLHCLEMSFEAGVALTLRAEPGEDFQAVIRCLAA